MRIQDIYIFIPEILLFSSLMPSFSLSTTVNLGKIKFTEQTVIDLSDSNEVLYRDIAALTLYIIMFSSIASQLTPSRVSSVW